MLQRIFSFVGISYISAGEISKSETFVQWRIGFANKRFCWFNEDIHRRTYEANNCHSSYITGDNPMISTLQLPIADYLQHVIDINHKGIRKWIDCNPLFIFQDLKTRHIPLVKKGESKWITMFGQAQYQGWVWTWWVMVKTHHVALAEPSFKVACFKAQSFAD